MAHFIARLGLVALSGLLAPLSAFGCSGTDGNAGPQGTIGATGTPGVAGADALMRSVAEPAGVHCPFGGESIALGADLNGNHELDESEVTNTAYACDGAPSGAQLTQLPIGDPNCPYGGFSIAIDESNPLFACNGTPGTSGAAGEKGDKGDKGEPGGPAGPAGPKGDPGAPAPRLHRFFLTQVVDGLVLTCSSTGFGIESFSCDSPKLNGENIRGTDANANEICNAVNLTIYRGYSSLAQSAGIYFDWTGTTWTTVTLPAANAPGGPISTLRCPR